MIEKAILYTDGGSRGNPGPSGIGYSILADDGREPVPLSEGGAFIGKATNNIAEYQALLWGLDNALALGVRHLDIRADSELLVKQIKGEYKVKSEGIKPLFLQVLTLLRSLDSFDISHVYRQDNSRADTLANEAMDVRESVGSFTVPCVVSATGSLDNSDVEKGHHAQVQDTGNIQDKNNAQGMKGVQDKNNALNAKDAFISSTNEGGTMKTGRYSLTIKDHFDAAHALVGYPGECRQLHGHTWDIEVTVSGTELDEVGIVYDFKALKADLATILDEYDHKYLNEVPPFDRINATAENLARIIYERLETSLPSNVSLDEIGVWESPIAKLTYRKQ